MSDLDRFLTKVAPPNANGCELWTAGTRSGYGHFRVGSRRDGTLHMARAHRWIYEQRHGPIPAGIQVRHTCDVKLCQTDSHHVLGTNRDNCRDRVERGRSLRGSRHNMAKLTEEDVLEIRTLWATGLHQQRELADRFGVSQPNISKIVRGRLWVVGAAPAGPCL